MRKTTVKEVKTWMKTLEENRYKKTYNSDCRRVSWLVNNKLSEDYETMPKSMKKKWPQAAYKRERYLAKEYVKHLKSKFVNELTRLKENKLRKLIREVIKRELNEVRTQKIFVDKKNFKKAHNILKKNKNKIKNVSMVVGNKDSKTSYIQIPYQVYNKALEVLMKNNIKVRG